MKYLGHEKINAMIRPKNFNTESLMILTDDNDKTGKKSKDEPP